ncbi:hypothetical protein NQ315_000253 [Exocentrus adspersus]|uniref:Uncharacterized protein n=1 Tax=Exocentrus adspersus TaxID=1586481 RepID=A0AAV8VQF2_9CUCU|nr:hypothetical protein NQ315_000253 [Exocentrus adspersus]
MVETRELMRLFYLYRMANAGVNYFLGQSDIKKLKRENEMLKKGLWYLRDEYDKLEKLIKDKKLDFYSSSSSCSSSSGEEESCTSCGEEGEEVETTQNIKNVQRTNLRNIKDQFDHLSVVTEETSAENSEQNSNRASLPNDWNHYDAAAVRPLERVPLNFFSPMTTTSRSDSFNNLDYPRDTFLSQKVVQTNANNFYQNMVLVPKPAEPPPESRGMEKASTDLIVKMDNRSFSNCAPVPLSQSTFSNGGNLEELLNDIESISQEILKLTNLQRCNNADDAKRFILEVRSEDQDLDLDNSQHVLPMTPERPYKSELNVVLMPNPMPLIGFDKYRNIQRSLESLDAKPLEELSTSRQNLCSVPPPVMETGPILPPPPQAIFLGETGMRRACVETETNPFFFANLTDNYVNADYFNMRYNPDNFPAPQPEQKTGKAYDPKAGSKTNLLDLTSSEHVSSENEENLKFKTSKPENGEPAKLDDKPQEVKSPKLSIRRKVSIHFKGKKEKAKKAKEEAAAASAASETPRTPGERKSSIFDLSFGSRDKDKQRVKTPSAESRVSTTETSNQEPKTPTSTDSKTSNERMNSKREEARTRKSASVSPERSRHVHVKGEGGKKHKKHKKSDRGRMRKPSVMMEPRGFRERSFSVCTDRSNVLEHRLGLGLGLGSSYLYDDYSDRERTNSLSSCETSENARKLSTMSNVPLSGKVPWCGCWGNGCL